MQLWRVKDLLDLFDGNPKFKGCKIDNFARKWAQNADEYLCWELLPKEALIKFVPYTDLTQLDDELEDVLLRPVFLKSKKLGDFRKLSYPFKTLTMDQYEDQIGHFMQAIMDHVALDVDADLFVNTLVEGFRDPVRWGYVIRPGGGDLERMLRRVIDTEYGWGANQWVHTDPEHRFVKSRNVSKARFGAILKL